MAVRTTLFLILAAGLAGCTTGSRIATAPGRPAVTAETVKVYSSPPADFETLGMVNAESNAALTWTAAHKRALARLRKEAAALGANGLLLESSENDFWLGAKVSAKAIHVRRE